MERYRMLQQASRPGVLKNAETGKYASYTSHAYTGAYTEGGGGQQGQLPPPGKIKLTIFILL